MPAPLAQQRKWRLLAGRSSAAIGDRAFGIAWFGEGDDLVEIAPGVFEHEIEHGQLPNNCAFYSIIRVAAESTERAQA